MAPAGAASQITIHDAHIRAIDPEIDILPPDFSVGLEPDGIQPLDEARGASALDAGRAAPSVAP